MICVPASRLRARRLAYTDRPLGVGLDRLVEATRRAGRRIVVQRYRDARAARPVHVLYVAATERDWLEAVFAALHDRPVLTVSDFHGFLRRGGMMRFSRNAENWIRVRFNLDARLTISAKLLQVVAIVPREEE